jgi:hypothetical protein
MRKAADALRDYFADSDASSDDAGVVVQDVSDAPRIDESSALSCACVRLRVSGTLTHVLPQVRAARPTHPHPRRLSASPRRRPRLPPPPLLPHRRRLPPRRHVPSATTAATASSTRRRRPTTSRRRCRQVTLRSSARRRCAQRHPYVRVPVYAYGVHALMMIAAAAGGRRDLGERARVADAERQHRHIVRDLLFMRACVCVRVRL